MGGKGDDRFDLLQADFYSSPEGSGKASQCGSRILQEGLGRI